MAQQIDHVRVAELIESIGKDSKQLASGGVRAQVALLEKAHRLCQALETPQQAMMKLCLVGVCIGRSPGNISLDSFTCSDESADTDDIGDNSAYDSHRLRPEAFWPLPRGR